MRHKQRQHAYQPVLDHILILQLFLWQYSFGIEHLIMVGVYK